METTIAVQEYLREAPRAYRTIVLGFAGFCPKLVGNISRETWENYVEFVKANYKDTGIKDKLTKAKCFLNDCVAKGYLKLNTKKFKIPKTLSRRVVAQAEQIAKMESLLDLNDFEDLRDYLLLQCMRMGMRVGEIAALNREHIGGAKQYVDKQGKVSYYCPIISEKSLQERYIMWSTKNHQHFLRYLGIVICLNQRKELFINSDRTRISTRLIQRAFNSLRIQAGIAELISPHSVRHMAAHTDLDNGATLKQIQTKLGHTNPTSTFNYINQTPTETLKGLSEHTT